MIVGWQLAELRYKLQFYDLVILSYTGNIFYFNIKMLMFSGLPPNLGSAVASSMHLTNSTDPLSDPASHYKMIESSDMLSYYPVNKYSIIIFSTHFQDQKSSNEK